MRVCRNTFPALLLGAVRLSNAAPTPQEQDDGAIVMTVVSAAPPATMTVQEAADKNTTVTLPGTAPSSSQVFFDLAMPKQDDSDIHMTVVTPVAQAANVGPNAIVTVYATAPKAPALLDCTYRDVVTTTVTQLACATAPSQLPPSANGCTGVTYEPSLVPSNNWFEGGTWTFSSQQLEDLLSDMLREAGTVINICLNQNIQQYGQVVGPGATFAPEIVIGSTFTIRPTVSIPSQLNPTPTSLPAIGPLTSTVLYTETITDGEPAPSAVLGGELPQLTGQAGAATTTNAVLGVTSILGLPLAGLFGGTSSVSTVYVTVCEFSPPIPGLCLSQVCPITAMTPTSSNFFKRHKC